MSFGECHVLQPYKPRGNSGRGSTSQPVPARSTGEQTDRSEKAAAPTDEPQGTGTTEMATIPMQTNAIDYNEVLRDLTDRRNELEAAIRAIGRIAGHAVPHPSPASAPEPVPAGRVVGGHSSGVAAAASIRAALDRTET